MLDRVVVDESIEVLRQHTGHCGRATRAGAIGETLDPVVGQAMDPLAQRGVGKVERGGDGVEAMPLDDVTDRLGATEDTGLLRLLQEGSEGRKGVLGKVEFEGPHSGGLQEKVRQKTTKIPCHTMCLASYRNKVFSPQISLELLNALKHAAIRSHRTTKRRYFFWNQENVRLA